MTRDAHDEAASPARLRAILEAYGGDPLRWPEAERDAMVALLAQSDEARRLHRQALSLDAALDALPALAPSAGLEERIVAVTRAPGAGSTPARPAAHRAGATPRGAGRGTRRRVRILAASLPLAAAAALGLWVFAERSTPVAPSPEPTLEMRLAEIGGYDTPGDALLDVAGVDAYEIDPWVGCPESVLGCLEAESEPDEPLSLEDQEERFYS